jgi:hypothetical protein
MAKEINLTDTEKKKVVSTQIQKTAVESDTKKKETEVKEEKKKRRLSKKALIIIAISFGLLLVVGIASFYYFGIYRVKPNKSPAEVINISTEYLISKTRDFGFSKIPTLIPQEPKTEVSPINGLLYTKTEMAILKTRRPVAVILNNHSVARPQSGLNSADIVYEAVVESGITRYLAIYWSEYPAKVGPIRSVRQYYLEWLNPYDPLLLYDGCAQTDNPKTNACGNIHTYNIKNLATIGAWRWNDGRRYAPHNEYTSITNAWDYAKRMNWNNFPEIKAWKFKNDSSLSERGEKTKVDIIFNERLNNSGHYDATWIYNQKTNTYVREVGKQADIDQETNTQVYAKNVIIQEVVLTPTYDDKGRIIIETMGEGNAVFLIDGKITEGKWRKNSRTDRTTYYDNSGKEIEFNRGRIWISAVPRSQGKFAIIEQ